jgi:anti-anti-sigma regulatory factor
MFKIRRSEDKDFVTFVLSGRIEEEQLSELQKLLKIESSANPTPIALDLGDVRLVDREAIKFLAACEAHGIALKNCPSYVREWIETGRGISNEP